MASSTKSKKQHKKKDKGKGDKKPKKKDRKLSAKTADKYDLYQRAVNSPDTDVDFVTSAYEEHRGKPARHLREDFCGTASFTAEFLKRHPDNSAEGFDLDPEPVEWGKQRNFGKVENLEQRMTWHLADVRSPADKRPDITSAQNFSYWCFHTRKELASYFKAVFADLADDGVFILDLYGGPEALNEMEELRDIDGAFTYVWDQDEFWPGTGEYNCYIHFRFKDGSEMEKAFEYKWRFWHLTELKDLLEEIGFVKVLPYFEGTDEDDEEEGNGEFTHDARGENCEAWIGYLVALK